MFNSTIPDWLLVVLALACLPLVCVLPAFVAGLAERRRVWHYVPLDASAAAQVGPSDRMVAGPTPRTIGSTFAQDLPDDRNPYRPPRAVGSAPDPRVSQPPLTSDSMRANAWFREQGYLSLGTFADGTSRLYQIRYDFWLTPDRRTLAIVGGGTIIRVPDQATWLCSRLTDGSCLITVDDRRGTDPELRGRNPTMIALIDEVLFETSLPSTLTAEHQRRLELVSSSVIPYSQNRPLDGYLQVRIDRADQLEALGRIRYLDPSRSVWKYTIWGTGRRVISEVWWQLRNGNFG